MMEGAGNTTLPGNDTTSASATFDKPVVDLSRYQTANFDRGASRTKEACWILLSALVFRALPICASRLKCGILRLFGAEVGRNVVIKPNVKITFPWKLRIGNNVWIGEEAWILNLAPVVIGSNVCISQRAFLCTGNHDYRNPVFPLITKPIRIDDGAWVGAAAFVGPGVVIHCNAVLTACSLASRDLAGDAVHQGQPAMMIRSRWESTEAASDQVTFAEGTIQETEVVSDAVSEKR